MRFDFIEAEKANYPVGILCRVLRVTRSGFYAWSERPESVHDRVDRQLAVAVRAVFTSNHGRYGSPRIHAELRAQGQVVGRHRVCRLMRNENLQARRRRRWVRTTDSRHTHPIPPNLVKRQFQASAPNQVWAGDVTFIATLEGWLYLAMLLDLYSRRVVGFAMSEKNDENQTLAALQMALTERTPKAGLIHHTDRGTTYAATEYQDVLRRHGIRCSMSRKANCLDNAVAESFFSTLKTECTASMTFTTRAAARRVVFEYVAAYYNSTRRHSTIGYVSPMEYEKAGGH